MLVRCSIALILLCLPTIAWSQSFDWSEFDRVLHQHVSSGSFQEIDANLVDYPALLNNRAFAEIAQTLALYDPSELAGNEQLAFYINAYNYFAIKIILDNWPVKGIKDIGSFFKPVWKRSVGKINGKAVTLDQIEHQILRTLGEPRIHFAIVCASMSCPDLRKEIYTAEKLDRQLDDQVRTFLDNPTKGARISDGELLLSKIFDWFEGDFDKRGGVLAFVSSYQPKFEGYNSFDTIDYNWQLNRVRQ